MSVRYSEDFKREVARAYMVGDKLTVEFAADYHVAQSTISECAKKYGEVCQYKNTTHKTNESDSTSEIRRLNRMLRERDKEI